MAYVQIGTDGNITGVFGRPQIDLPGYTEIADDDERLIAFNNFGAWLEYQMTAQRALDATDVVAMRCFKAVVAFPAEWQAYVKALRVIMAARTGDATQPLPAQPAYPAGT